MKRHAFHRILLATGLLVLSTVSCTNLTGTPYSQGTAQTFFKTGQQFGSALGTAYSFLGGYYNNLVLPDEMSTDEMVVHITPLWGYCCINPYYYNHLHTWDSKNIDITNAWTFLYGGINRCNRLVSQFNTLIRQNQINPDKAKLYISEMKVLRAFYYYWLLDMYGNVPIEIRFANISDSLSNDPVFQNGRTKVFHFVMQQIYDNMANLSTNADASTYGRITLWGAHFLLAKIYLNAGVYLGSYQFTKNNLDSVIANCNDIINSDKFHLAPNYFGNFKPQNQHSPEFIFSIPYDHVHLHGFDMDMALHYLSQQTFNLATQPWNGYSSLENFYNSFRNNDIRKTGFLHGYQKSSTGQYLVDPNLIDPLYSSAAPHGDTLYYSAHINKLEYPWQDAGVRFDKFRIAMGSTPDMDNDFPIFRYTDVLMMKAEALWRLNNSDTEALMLVNKIRERAGLSDYSSLNAYELLLERGHEFYLENWRRQDLIRFHGGMHFQYDSLGVRGSQYPGGTTAFNDAWWDKGVDPDTHVNVFPIPYNVLLKNPDLHQNPGYQ